MKLAKGDVLLYALWQLKAERPKAVYNMDQLAEAMDISKRTLNVYLTSLVKEGMIVRKGESHNRSIVDNIEMTDRAKERLSEVSDIIGTVRLSPVEHGIGSFIRLEDLLSRLSDPLERAFLLNLCLLKKRYDIGSFLLELSSAKNELSVVNYLRRLDEGSGEESAPYGVDMFRMSLYGDKTAFEAHLVENMSKGQIDAVLVHAETLYKQGKLERAKAIYEHLLTDQPKITRNQWFQAKLGIAQVLRRREGPEMTIEYLDELDRTTEDKLFKSIILQAKGTCYGMMGDLENAIEHISAAIRSFRYFNHPLLLAISLNNRGVMYFSMNEIDLAFKDWTRAMVAAKKAGSRYVEARLLINLADVEIKRGDLKKAERLMSRSQRLFSAVNDLEGMSGLEFNRALKAIADKDAEGFRYHFERSESIADPLPPKYERDMRRKVLLERAMEGGMEEIAAFMKGLDPLDWKERISDGGTDGPRREKRSGKGRSNVWKG